MYDRRRRAGRPLISAQCSVAGSGGLLSTLTPAYVRPRHESCALPAGQWRRQTAAAGQWKGVVLHAGADKGIVFFMRKRVGKAELLHRNGTYAIFILSLMQFLDINLSL